MRNVREANRLRMIVAEAVLYILMAAVTLKPCQKIRTPGRALKMEYVGCLLGHGEGCPCHVGVMYTECRFHSLLHFYSKGGFPVSQR